MSKLKWSWVYYPYLDPPEKQQESALKAGYNKVYLKSEADKYIAMLKDKANSNEYAYKLKSKELADTCRFFEEENRHQKYKRCLAMAKWCRLHDEFTQLESERLGLQQRAIFMEYRRKAMWWYKWHKRWLELAKKFKEIK